MDYEESIDERNSMRSPYRFYDIGSVLIPVPEESMKLWTDKIEALLDKHSRPQVDIWKDVL